MRYVEPTLSSVATAIWRHWFLVSTSVLLAMGLSIAAYLKTPPIYEASASLLVGQANRLEGAVESAVPAEIMNSQTQIAGSDAVIRAAIAQVGIDQFSPDEPGPLDGLGGRLRGFIKGLAGSEEEVAAEDDANPELELAIDRVQRSMSVRAEPSSNVMTIGYRDKKPVLVADMSNALARAYIDQQNAMLEQQEFIDFLRGQTEFFQKDVARSAAALEQFMNRERVYSIDEQRSLLLHRVSESTAALGATRGSLAEKEGQKQALARQLALLDPVARSPFALGFVAELSPENSDEAARSLREEAGALPLRADDTPPLLMIKVFQDAMASYRILDADIGGLRRLETQRETEAKAVSAELARVTARQSEYERLRRELELTTFNAETFAKRTVQEQIDAELHNARLSTMQIIQPAVTPRRAASPKGVVYVGFGLAVGIVLGVALALAKETADLNRRPRRVGET